MSRTRKYRYFVCDFETTVFEGQQFTEVWSAASVEMFTEDVNIFHSIQELYDYFKSLKSNVVAYFHNLKFDGAFWLSFLMVDLKLEQAYKKVGKNEYDIQWKKPEDMFNNTFQYSISDMGMWYSIRIKVNDYMIEIRDSLKLLPFSVKKLGKDFKTRHQKLDMEYKGFRYSGCYISDKEKEYIRNDVLVVKEALEVMFKEGHKKLTIGACCLSEFKHIIGKKDFEALFPNVYDVPIDKKLYGVANVGEYINKSYKGGWCYLVKGAEGKIVKNGTTGDVNSLYPSMMSSESGNYYPVGYPEFWKGNFIPDEATEQCRYFFIRIKTRFYIKENMLPFIQIKGSMLYKGTESLESSDITDRKTGKKSSFWIDFDGKVRDTRVTLTLTCTDYYLLKEHYNLVDFEILDGCYFRAIKGLFDEYIEKYKKIKLESEGAKRGIAKLFLNNLYGKMASNTNSSFKFAYVKDDTSIGFVTIEDNSKEPGYIPVGSAITSYARNFTIRAAQKNYYGPGKRGFKYADTDSIHCDLLPEEIKGITVDDKNFCCWKLESSWDEGIFVRQKTYIEHVTHENLHPLDNPYYNVKCAGMPDACKDLFIKSMTGYEVREDDKYNEIQREFLKTKRTMKDFKIGLKIYGKLIPKRIRGGIVLIDGYYEMRKHL